ncbi:DUF5694 domain-containing protein [Alteromonas facilis]|uniref:DUF5694 domain-containing protein n=1 Tax=Alteromonas facilis TaxID=2048004 RepID=UPI000C283A6F|nr:DUF5694 domain-containing protein [Alteromonas facilis]
MRKITAFRQISPFLLCFVIASVNAATAKLPGTPSFERLGAAPMFNFAGVQSDIGSSPTRILVLGTSHLAYQPKESFDPAHLSIVLDRLTAFSPDIIAIEAVNGRTCDEIQRYDALYPSVQQYCTDTQEVLKSLNMTRPEAASAVEKFKRHWPQAPSPADRRRLALMLYASGEIWSATLQWAKLTSNQRIPADGVTDPLVNALNKNINSRNENNLIGVEIAHRMQLDMITMMDDHSADYIYLHAPESLLPAIQAVWKKEHPLQQQVEQMLDSLTGSPEAMLKNYLYINSAAYQRYTIENDFGLATASTDQNGVARQYVAWWQVRGLRMAANVLEAAGNHPGANVLVITGSSHKAYFESYLDQMHDIELVSVESVLTP